MSSWYAVSKTALVAVLIGVSLTACSSGTEGTDSTEAGFVADIEDPKYQLNGETNLNLTVEDFERDFSQAPNDALAPICELVAEWVADTSTEYADFMWDQGYTSDQIVNAAVALHGICEERGLWSR